MAKNKKEDSVTPNDLNWTDHVLDSLSEDEKIKGNPTTDGLRRIFETVLDCVVIDSSSSVLQSPDMNNEKRATVVHSLTYVLNDSSLAPEIKKRTVNGAADVYWGNCDKIFRNHPVAVAETRAEGRALRRALKLRKVVAAEELAEEIEDNPDSHTIGMISNNQINFIDVLSRRLDINVLEILKSMNIENNDINSLTHSDAVDIIRKLSGYQQNIDSIPEDIKSYTEQWR